MDFSFIFPMNTLHWWLLSTGSGIVCLVVALRILERKRLQRLAAFVSAELTPKLLVGYDGRIRRPLGWLTVLGFLFLALAFAQPHWGHKWQSLSKQSRDILICLDVSNSMMASNPPPTRLDRARQKIDELTKRMPADRFGLIAFAGAADLQCPLTLDQGYFKAVLKAVDINSISFKGTDIAGALDTAIETFEADEKDTGAFGRQSKAILLISDGEQVSGDALKAAEKAAEHATIYVMGIGDPNGAEVRLPEWLGKSVSGVDPSKPHVSKLDEDTLIRIATTGNGRYVRSQIDNWDIDQLYEHLSKQSTRTVGSDIRFQLVNRYQWPLFLAILCFAGEGLWLVLMPRILAWRMRRHPPLRGEASYV